MTRELHKCVVAREPLFAATALASSSATLEVGDGQFSVALWNVVLQFLYNGSVVLTRPELESLQKLLRVHRIECLVELVEAEMRAYADSDAAHALAVEEAKAQGAPVPVQRAPERACIDGSGPFLEFVASLLHGVCATLAMFCFFCAHVVRLLTASAAHRCAIGEF